MASRSSCTGGCRPMTAGCRSDKRPWPRTDSPFRQGARMCLAIPGEVMEVTEEHGLRFAQVRFGGILRQVCLECQPEARPGDFVLVHVGFAISKIDREEAARTW